MLTRFFLLCYFLGVVVVDVYFVLFKTGPMYRSCPFPHWTPVIPPILATIISILMVPCYCYSCGPWSGPHWAEERRKLMQHNEHQILKTKPSGVTIYVGGYNSAGRIIH